MAERERIQRDVPETYKGAPEEKGKAKKNKQQNKQGEGGTWEKITEQAQKQFESDQEDLKIVEELAWGSRNSEQGEKSDVFWIAHWGWSKEPSTQKQKAVAPEIYTQDQGKNQGLVKFPISITGLKSYKSSAEWMNECDSEVPRDRYREPTSEHVTCKSVMKYTNYTSDRKTSGVKAKFKVLSPLLENWYWHFQSILPNLVSAHRVRLWYSGYSYYSVPSGAVGQPYPK